ncbi:GNAT family N-acetyltransferase [Serratia quinivorans]|uniref:GNAT family N-acetyltransferase n=1 Tax=Serratia quinivorans TaxID=137545 RepID=UPI003F95B847
MEDVIIGNAKKSDAGEVVRLIALADKDAVLALSGKDDINEALLQYEMNFGRNDVYFGYKNVFVARDQEKILGCILYFKGEDESGFTAITEPHAEMENESDPDEIYIDSLAVLPECRGRGIAKSLISRVVEEARQQGLNKVGLLADTKKPHLKALYRTLGFNVTAEIKLLNDHYEKMTVETGV